MALPVVKQPTHSMTIKELGDSLIKFRPFVNGEHKALMTANELSDENSVFNTTLDIIDSCTFKTQDVKKLPPHIIDFQFLQIYSKSLSNKAPAKYKCSNVIDNVNFGKVVEEVVEPVDPLKEIKQLNSIERVKREEKLINTTDEKIECGFEFNVVFPIDDASIKYPENYEEKSLVVVNSSIKIKLKAPSAFVQNELNAKLKDVTKNKGDTEEELRAISKATSEVNDIFVFNGIEYIEYDGSKLYPEKDFSLDEFIAWVDTFPGKAQEDILEFYATKPDVFLEHLIVCPKCKYNDMQRFEGLDSFFA